jgi:hypothetical protein
MLPSLQPFGSQTGQFEQGHSPGLWLKPEVTPQISHDDMLAIAQMMRAWNEAEECFEAIDSVPGQVAMVTVGETREAEEEHHLFESHLTDAGHVVAEVGDILAPLMKRAANLNLFIDLAEVLRRVNGFGRHSNVYDLTVDVGENLSSNPNKLPKEIEWAMTLALSALAHMPNHPDLLAIMVEKIMVNYHNYPPELFLASDEQGRALDRDAQIAKYLHTIKCLKWLRSTMPGRILPADWRLVKPQIMDFKSGDRAFQLLKDTWRSLHPNPETAMVGGVLIGASSVEQKALAYA